MKANNANESSIYNAIISWIHCGKESRSEEFLEQLFLIDSTKLKVDIIKKMVLSELATENHACLTFVTKEFVNASNTDFIKRNAETARVIRVGGSKPHNKVDE